MKNVPIVTVVRHLNSILLEAEQCTSPEIAASHYQAKVKDLVYALEFYEEAHPIIEAARPQRKTKRHRKK